jgi:type VI secretion system secreted protein Hcp
MAVDYFLKVDGIAGESTDAKHKNEIDVVGFNFGVSNASGPGPGGGGGGAGKSVFDSLVVLAPMSKASPLLWAACASGKHIKTVVLTGRRTAMKTQAEFLKVTLSDAIITSYQAEGADDDGPLDEVAFDYGKIEVAYTPVDSTGKAQPPVKAGWDVVKQTKV